MIFVLKMLFTFVHDRKNENHWSLLIIRYKQVYSINLFVIHLRSVSTIT